MGEFVGKINGWLVENLGAWTLEYFGLWLIIAAVLALVLIITIIAVAACHAKNKKKFKALNEKANGAPKSDIDEAELREKIRAEITAEQGDGAAKAAEAQNAASILSARVDEQKRRIEELEDGNKEKQNRIDELSAMLEQANSDVGAINNDLYRQINELSQTTREQENEINLLKAENAQIKAQALQQQLAATTASAEAKPARATTAKAAAAEPKQPARTAKKNVAAAETTAVEDVAQDDDDDEYDEYYDDYGDETSAVKVTLKFDRIKNNWIILRSDTDRTYRRLATKQEALVIAKDLARRLHAQLVVHKKDGKFQRI